MANEDLQTKSIKALENIIKYNASAVLTAQDRMKAATAELQRRAQASAVSIHD